MRRKEARVNPDDPFAGLDDIFRPEQPEEAESPVQTKRKKRRWIIPVSIIGGVLVLALIAVGAIALKANSVLNSIQRDPSLSVDDAPMVEASKPVNVVIMGSDSRGSDQGRSDVLMLAHLTTDRTKMYLISFPRDMYVSIPGHGKNKINAAYSFGGPALTIKTLNELLGIKANHAAEIDFESFMGLSDAIGGVTVDNDISFKAGGYDYPKGKITMSGQELLTYVRERHAVPKGDLDRAHHQRMVLKAMMTKLMSKGVVTNVPTLLNVSDQVGQFVTVDDKLTNNEIVGIVTSLKLDGSASMIDLQAPISGFGRSPAGASIDVVDQAKMKKLATALQDDTMDEYVDKYGTGY